MYLEKTKWQIESSIPISELIIEPAITICSFIDKKIPNDHNWDALYIPLHKYGTFGS
jgi:hypothetical protein